MRRKTSGLDGVPPSNRLRLTILLATVAAFLLVPAAQAFAIGAITVNVEGSGHGEVTSVGGIYGEEGPSGLGESSPPIECAYAGEGLGTAAGTCETPLEEIEPGFSAIAVRAVPTAGSELAEFTIDEGEGLSFDTAEAGSCSTEEMSERVFSGCTLLNETPPGNVEITVVFTKFVNPALTLDIEEGSGTVVSNPAGISCSGEAPKSCVTGKITEGTKVTLTASPATGYAFKSWKGCDSGGVNGRQCTVTLSSAKTVGAKFYKTWNLTGTKSNPNGIFSTSPGGVNCGYGCLNSKAEYKEGALTLKAKPAKNFHFVEFKGGTGSAASCNGVTTETCSIATFSSNSSIQEVYAENVKHTLSLEKFGGGQGFVKTKPTNINCGYTCTQAEAEFFASEEVPVTVTLNKGTTQVTWTHSAGTCTGHALSCAVPMSTGQALRATFE